MIVRPIVRGKTAVPVGFGAKPDLSIDDSEHKLKNSGGVVVIWNSLILKI